MKESTKHKLYEAFGEVSMCWSERPKGIFDSTQVTKIAERIVGLIEADEYFEKENSLLKEGSGVHLIAIERKEQIEIHWRTLQRDVDENSNNELAHGAEMLLAAEHEEGIDTESYPDGWDKEICTHMLSKPYKERLIIAGALIAAEIDRLSSTQPHNQ